MVGRYEERSYWAGGGAVGQTAQQRLKDLSTPVSSGNRFISTHDAVCQAIFNPNGTGEFITTAEYMEGDALIIRPLGGTEHEILAQWCSETWTRYHVRFPDQTTGMRSDVSAADGIGISPVPASDHIKVTASAPGRLRVVNLLGADVAVVDIGDSRSTSIDVSSWPIGTYVVMGDSQSAIFSVVH
jgi:hypothetical protein